MSYEFGYRGSRQDQGAQSQEPSNEFGYRGPRQNLAGSPEQNLVGGNQGPEEGLNQAPQIDTGIQQVQPQQEGLNQAPQIQQTPWIAPPVQETLSPDKQTDTGLQTPVEMADLSGDPNKLDRDTTLKNEGYVTKGGQLNEDYWLQGMQTGEFGDVENLKRISQNQNEEYEYKLMKQAKEMAGAQGLQPGTAGYQMIMQDVMGEMNQRRLSSEQELINAQNKKMTEASGQLRDIEFGQREIGIGERNLRLNEESVQYNREKSEQVVDNASADKMIDSEENPKLQNVLKRAKAEGGWEAVKQAYLDNVGQYGEHADRVKPIDPIKTVVDGISKEVDAMTASPDGDAWKPGERDARKSQLLDSELRDKYGMNNEEIDKFNAENDVSTKVEGVLNGTVDIKTFTDTDWDNITEDDLRSISTDFNSGMSYNTTTDFHASNLKADKITQRTDDEPSRELRGEGEGNGSIINIGGVPHRIVRFDEKTDTTFTNEVIGRVYAVPLSGPNKGKEVEVSSSGWRDK